jgi:hypothetical protein
VSVSGKKRRPPESSVDVEAYEKKRYIKTYLFRKAKSTGGDHSGVGSLNREGERTEFHHNFQIA